MKEFLEPTYFIDFDSEEIDGLVNKISKEHGDATKTELAIIIFNFVRDNYPYTVREFQVSDPLGYKASSTFKAGKGFCMTKSILLVALLRANNIPARLHIADMINHRSPKHFRDLMGGSAYFVYHTYVDVFLNNKWLKITPSFEKQLCEKHNYPLCDFDGKHDAILKPYDLAGEKFIEYVKDHGTYIDFPFDQMVEAVVKFYGPLIG
ncbi:MAG: transglutaminase-like domain-containing protein [Candidatus Hodarchaeales archaeon]|jgi:transglutaminase-like putative cysteine protease